MGCLRFNTDHTSSKGMGSYSRIRSYSCASDVSVVWSVSANVSCIGEGSGVGVGDDAEDAEDAEGDGDLAVEADSEGVSSRVSEVHTSASLSCSFCREEEDRNPQNRTSSCVNVNVNENEMVDEWVSSPDI